MGERKVLNKYIPADFDPKLVPRGKKPKDDLIPVRMMLPFTVQCSTCSSFMYRGRKFNSKKEAVKGSEGKYLGIQRFRFYIKCTACSRPITFLTDPQNADYEMESGGTRTYEVHKDRAKQDKETELEEAKAEKLDPMKALENRVLASQKEMADLDNLDEIKAMNLRHLRMLGTIGAGIREAEAMGHVADATSAILGAKHDKNDEKDPLELDESDEALVKSIKFGKRQNKKGNSISRLTKFEEEEMIRRRESDRVALEKQQLEMVQKSKAQKLNKLNFKVKRKRKVSAERSTVVKKNNNPNDIPKEDGSKSESTEKDNGNALGLLAAYSDSDSD